MNVFQVADNDQSILFLGQIFGNVGIALTGSGSALLSNMFKTFNGILLVIGSFFVIYVTIVGLIETSQEGSFMGKKFNSVWTPLRMVMGIAALFPTKSGYCAIQTIIMWVIVQGIGAADTVWKTTVDYVALGGIIHDAGSSDASTDMTKQGSTTVNPDSQGYSQQVYAPNAVQQLFTALVCQAVAVKTAKKDPKAVAHSKLNDAGTGYDFGRDFTVAEDAGSRAPTKECGSVSWANNNAALQKGLGDALQSLVPVLETLADKYVISIINSESCWEPCQTTGFGGEQCIFGKWKSLKSSLPKECPIKNPSGWNTIYSFAGSNFMSDAILLMAGYANNYEVNAAIERSKKEQEKTGSLINNDPVFGGGADRNQAYRKAQANGWIFAGAYYFYITSQANTKAKDFSSFYSAINFSNPTVINQFENGRPASQTPDDFSRNGYFMQYAVCGVPDASKNNSCTLPGGGGAVDIVIEATKAMQTAQDTGGIDLQSNGSAGPSTAEFGKINAAAQNIINMWMRAIAGGNDPLIAMQSFGTDLLIAAEVLFWVYFAASLVLGYASAHVVVFGTTVTPWYQMFANLFQMLTGVTFFLIIYMIIIGGLLGVYTPLIPYIIFTFGAIAWFISVVEAMVAAPIVALGVLAPGGHHEVLGKAEPAVGILLGTFLRPTLMVFGMMGAMLLSYVVVKMINLAFMGVVFSIHGGNRGMGLLEIFLFIMAYTGLVITALNKCFSLIHIIPERTLRWIGFQGEQGGEEQSAQAVQGKVSAGSEAGGKASSGVGSSASGHAGQISKNIDGKPSKPAGTTSEAPPKKPPGET